MNTEWVKSLIKGCFSLLADKEALLRLQKINRDDTRLFFVLGREYLFYYYLKYQFLIDFFKFLFLLLLPIMLLKASILLLNYDISTNAYYLLLALGILIASGNLGKKKHSWQKEVMTHNYLCENPDVLFKRIRLMKAESDSYFKRLFWYCAITVTGIILCEFFPEFFLWILIGLVLILVNYYDNYNIELEKKCTLIQFKADKKCAVACRGTELFIHLQEEVISVLGENLIKVFYDGSVLLAEATKETRFLNAKEIVFIELNGAKFIYDYEQCEYVKQE